MVVDGRWYGMGGASSTTPGDVTSIGYAYVDNNGQLAYSPSPITYVGQGAGPTGSPNPGLIVNAQGTVISGPGTGGQYNVGTNTVDTTNGSTAGTLGSAAPVLVIVAIAALAFFAMGSKV